MAAMLLAAPKPAHATTFTVTNTNDSGAGSLRQAIDATNANAGADAIKFNIPGNEVKTISPASALPDITDTVAIDGYTQPGTEKNTLAKGTIAVLKIELNGENAGNAAGLQFDPRVAKPPRAAWCGACPSTASTVPVYSFRAAFAQATCG
jgi:hypothetical protein